ncbi:hypothetical protein [Leptolyngbya sp. FACHB-16]|nr:hypothetical protein [Leptolyngbya sp. FACHB-16]
MHPTFADLETHLQKWDASGEVRLDGGRNFLSSRTSPGRETL